MRIMKDNSHFQLLKVAKLIERGLAAMLLWVIVLRYAQDLVNSLLLSLPYCMVTREKEAWFLDYIIEHTHRVSRSSITSSSFTWHLPLLSSLLTSYLTDKLKNVRASDLCVSQHKYWLYEAVIGLSVSLSLSSWQCDCSAAPGSFHTRLLRWVVYVRSNNGWFASSLYRWFSVRRWQRLLSVLLGQVGHWWWWLRCPHQETPVASDGALSGLNDVGALRVSFVLNNATSVPFMFSG